MTTKTDFKAGQKVRRTGDPLKGKINNRDVNTGDVLEITSVATIFGEIYLRFFGETTGHSKTGFELVVVEPTDEELAAEYRKNYARQIEIRRLLHKKGYDIKLGGRPLPLALPSDPKPIAITKTITSTKEI